MCDHVEVCVDMCKIYLGTRYKNVIETCMSLG